MPACINVLRRMNVWKILLSLYKEIINMVAETLYIKSFGPVSEAEVKFHKLTVFIGRQGSGKSTIVKLYSLFSWLEKALMRHSVTEKYLTQYSRFRKMYCAYNNMDDYFTADTILDFSGIHYSFHYQAGVLDVKHRVLDDSFYLSKVMYIPAERNILGSQDHPSQLKGLSKPMEAFREEFERAKISMKIGYKFPFESVDFEYDALNDMPRLKHANYEIKLTAGSSGFQTSLPMLLVSKYLTELVRNSLTHSELSDKERKALQREVELIMDDVSLSDDVKKASLRSLSSRFMYSRFVNIVEEMELNLFPDSQKGVLYELIEDTKTLDGNKLILTTHSPYVINYLTLSLKAYELMAKVDAEDLKEQICGIVPLSSQLSPDDVAIYETASGKASLLADYEGLPSDDNFLNNRLEDTNLDFNKLLDIEEMWECRR